MKIPRQLCLLFVTALAFHKPSFIVAQQEGTCADDALSQDELEAQQGLNPLSARVAVVSGQVPNLQKCGEWCQGVLEENPTTPCRMDTDYVPCQGDFHCTTTCRLWHDFVLRDPLNGFAAGEGLDESQRPAASCAMFKRFDAYASSQTSEPCDISCLLPEIRPHRYPGATGRGLMCETGTCYPVSAAPRHQVPDASYPPAVLECPCNWFGSSCDNDNLPIASLEHVGHYGSLVLVNLTVAPDHYQTLMENHQAGGVVRITHKDLQDRRTQEQPYAIARAFPSEGTVQVLSAEPDATLDIVPRLVAELVRTNDDNLSNKLALNPSIAGFFNSRWQFLLPFLEANHKEIKHVVLVSTGAGLSGALSALQHVLPLLKESKGLDVRMYHGVRTLEELPYQDYLHEQAKSAPRTTWTRKPRFRLTLVPSRQPKEESEANTTLPSLQKAVHRGLGVVRKIQEGQKVYTQHVLEHDLWNSKKALTLANSVFVVCGRLALLEDTKAVLERTFCPNKEQDCLGKVGQHYFTNI